MPFPLPSSPSLAPCGVLGVVAGEAGFQNSVAKFMKQAGFSSPLLPCPCVQTFAWWLHGNRDATMEYSSQGARRNPSVELCGNKVRVSSLLLLREQFTEEL